MGRKVTPATLALVGLIGLGTVPATAADVIVDEAPPATAPTWSGIYVGVHGGMSATDLRYEQLPVPGILGGGLDYEFGARDAAYGFHLGGDYQFSQRFVAGVELDLTALNSPFAPFQSGGFGDLAEVKSSFGFSGRIGYLFRPETLVYGRIGAARVKIETEEGLTGTSSDNVGALLVGAGIETFLSGNLTGRVDLSYLDPRDATINADLESFEPRILLMTAGLSYRFGAQQRGGEAPPPAPETTFNGAYIGVAGSLGFAMTDLASDVPGATVGPFAADGGGGSIFAGYDFRLGSFVVGGEVEYAKTEFEFNDPTQNAFTAATTLFATVDATFGASARLGYVFTPSTLAYVKAGYAGFRTEANEEFFALDGSGSDTLSGYQVGVGLEAALSQHVTLRIEGTYAEATDSLVVTNNQLQQNEIKPEATQGKVGLAYRF